MQSYDDPVQTIRVVAGDTFSIALAGNPTTGYTWQAEIDAQYLELLAQAFEPGSEAIGAGGQELFRLRARKTGETEVGFAYRRPWAGEPLDLKSFRVVIEP